MKKILPIFLPLILALGLSGIYFLPTAESIAQSAVMIELPSQFAGWDFTKVPPSEEEIGALSKDTLFSKATCLRPSFVRYNRIGEDLPDRINLSIVLSGTDINNSIHRPERCMPAQGHQIISSRNKDLELKNGQTLEMKILESIRRVPKGDEGSGEFHTLANLTYYFFVGHNKITNDHLERTLIDMKDRLIRGMDQRWAYVSVSALYGDLPWNAGPSMSKSDTEKMLEKFIVDFSLKQIDWDQVR